MLLPSKDGILCDMCGNIHKKVFTYFSMEGTTKVINTTQQRGSVVLSRHNSLDLDICEVCYNNILNRCRNALKKMGNPTIFKGCELCSTRLNGNFTFIQLLFTKVDVSSHKDEPDVDKNVMDMKICDPCRAVIEHTIINTRKKFVNDTKSL